MSSPSLDGGLLEGLLEKKPVSVLARSIGSTWRPRYIVLRAQSLEWHHGGDESGELQVLLLDARASQVRAAGDAGDDAERCLTVSGTVRGQPVCLVLRCSDASERDAWVRAVCRCIESLKAIVFDAAVAQAERNLETIAREHGARVRRAAAVREGVRLLMERFFSSSAAVASETESFEPDQAGLADALASCLLTRQAEARACAAASQTEASAAEPQQAAREPRAAAVKMRCSHRLPCEQAEEELRELQLFSWQPLVAREVEENATQLVRGWGGAADLSSIAARLDWALGISEPFELGVSELGRFLPGERLPPPPLDGGPLARWQHYRACVHSALVRRLVALAIGAPASLRGFAAVLEAPHSPRRTSRGHVQTRPSHASPSHPKGAVRLAAEIEPERAAAVAARRARWHAVQGSAPHHRQRHQAARRRGRARRQRRSPHILLFSLFTSVFRRSCSATAAPTRRTRPPPTPRRTPRRRPTAPRRACWRWRYRPPSRPRRRRTGRSTPAQAG